MDLEHETVFASASGIDDAAQGLSTDPFGRSLGAGLGLRVPPVLPTITQDLQPRYLFLLASRTLGNMRTCIRGIRQLATIGVNVSATSGRTLIYELPIVTPHWRFPDGNISWHLVREPNDDLRINRPDQQSKATANWNYLTADQPSMLFQDFTNSNVTATGSPVIYNVGLTTYTPPDLSAFRVSPVADLGNMKGIYYPWAPESDDKLNIVVAGNCKVSLYASVLQSNPQTRLKPTSLTAANVIPCGINPEDAFISNFTSGGGDFPIVSPIYWRIGGSILFDDAFGAD